MTYPGVGATSAAGFTAGAIGYSFQPTSLEEAMWVVAIVLALAVIGAVAVLRAVF